MEGILSAKDALNLVKLEGVTEDTHLLYLSHELMRKERDDLSHALESLMTCDCMVDFRASRPSHGHEDA